MSKTIQISSYGMGVYALNDDGSIWRYRQKVPGYSDSWDKIPAIPDESEEGERMTADYYGERDERGNRPS